MSSTACWTAASAFPLLLLLGCAGNDSGAISLGTASAPPDSSLPMNIVAHPHEAALGRVSVHVSATGEVEVGETRINQAIGDTYLVGLNSLAERNFAVTGISSNPVPGGAELVLDVGFRHPFPMVSRPDLFGWDLKAILATDRDAVVFPAAGVTVAPDVLRNAAGYTTEWSPEIAAALPTLIADTFPYVILGEDRTAPASFDFQAPAGFNVFPSGSKATGTLTLFMPAGESLDLELFFTVAYSVSATRPTRQSPIYTPPSGNSRAPWRLDASVITSDLSTDVGTSATCDLSIYDWQHGQALGSDVVSATVYCPELDAAPINAILGGGTGSDPTPISAPFTITNALGTFTGEETWALIAVADQLDDNNPGGTLGEPGITVLEDDFTTTRPLDEVKSFQVVRLDVENIVTPAFGLTLDPIVDLSVELGDDGREYSAAMVEESDGVVAVCFSVERPASLPSVNAEGVISERNMTTGIWSVATHNVGSGGGGGVTEFGWNNKVAPGWIQGDTLNTWNFGNMADHSHSNSLVFGHILPAAGGLGIWMYIDRAPELACSRIDGSIYSFGDTGSQILCAKGGPNQPDMPTSFWPFGGVPASTVDPRPNLLSRSRSSFTGADGSVHLAFQAADFSRVSYGKNASGNGSSWTITDLATTSANSWYDPALAIDESTGVYVAATQSVGADHYIQLFTSTNGGASFGPMQQVGATFATPPMDLSISSSLIAGYQVNAITYCTAFDPGRSEVRVRWTYDGGANWQDQLISSGIDSHSPDSLIQRVGDQYFAGWTADLGGRQQMQVRRGVFGNL